MKSLLSDDNKFLAYMDRHSRTPRAMFSGKQVNRLLEMAGEKTDEKREWVAWHYCDMRPTLEAARQAAREEG